MKRDSSCAVIALSLAAFSRAPEPMPPPAVTGVLPPKPVPAHAEEGIVRQMGDAVFVPCESALTPAESAQT